MQSRNYENVVAAGGGTVVAPAVSPNRIACKQTPVTGAFSMVTRIVRLAVVFGLFITLVSGRVQAADYDLATHAKVVGKAAQTSEEESAPDRSGY